MITDHATIGLLVTCDGSICDLPRGQYVQAEERVAKELRELGKPYAVVLNSAHPNAEETVELAKSLEEKYKAPVALVNCLEINAEDIRHILGLILEEFPVREIEISMPGWMAALEEGHWLKESIANDVFRLSADIHTMGQVRTAFGGLESNENVAGVTLSFMDMGTGRARVKAALKEDLYYKVLSELTGFSLKNDEDLINKMKELAITGKKYKKVEAALNEVERSGYGIVMPDSEDLTLEEPEIVRQPGGFGLRLRAGAPSIHMIKADVETEINPIVGSEQQSEELAANLKRQIEKDPLGIWETNMLGKSLYELASEGLSSKLEHIPEDARKKLSETLSRIVNEGSNGLLCILV